MIHKNFLDAMSFTKALPVISNGLLPAYVQYLEFPEFITLGLNYYCFYRENRTHAQILGLSQHELLLLRKERN